MSAYKRLSQILENRLSKTNEEVKGSESKAMKWLKARMDKKKALDAKREAAKAVKGSKKPTP